MTDRVDLHEELHRLVLRARWCNWLIRSGRNPSSRRVRVLSKRLDRWKPTWELRHINDDWDDGGSS